jgi:hypothetical protein
MGSYWFSVLRVLFCLPLFFVLCPLLNASLLVFGVVCFALFSFVLCLVSTVDCVATVGTRQRTVANKTKHTTVDTRQRTKANKAKHTTPTTNKDTSNSGHKTEQRQTKQNRQHRIPIKTQATVDTRQNKGKQNKTNNTELQ